MPSKYVDPTAVLQVIGSVYKNPELLDLTDKYTITEEDFPDEFHKVAFGSVYKLHELGAEKINIKSIADFLATRPKHEAVFKSQRGEEWLLKVAENAQLDAFDYYYQRLKKFTLLRMYDNFGIGVDDIYDTENLFDAKKKQQQEDFLDNSTLEDIAAVIDKRIEDIKLKYVNQEYEKAVQAGLGARDLIERLKENPEVGSPLYGDLINTVTRGARLKKFYLRSAATGTGKALPNETVIPTPEGYRKVGDIRPGDKLFAANGEETTVTQIHPQGKKTVWCVKFADGRVVKCCKEHLWEYYCGKDKRVADTQTMLKELDEGLHVKLCDEVQYSTKKYEYDPYVVGKVGSFDEKYLLGDCRQRYALLTGLEEAYGLDGKRKNVQVALLVPQSARLIEKIKQLLFSLGMNCTTTEVSGQRVKITAPIYNQSPKRLPIESIVETEEEAEMTCFTVDAPDHLFLANDYIVTHNTRTMIADACNLACDRIYDDRFGWIYNGIKQPTLYITTEQELEEIQTMMLAFLANVNEEHIITGKYENDEEKRIYEALEILEDSPLYVEEMPDFSLQDIENKIIKNIREHDVSYVFRSQRARDNEILCQLITGVYTKLKNIVYANGEA